jgi:hypothetical protein
MKTTRTHLRGVLLIAVLWLSALHAGAFYDPSIQRWPNRDPLGEYGGVNLYVIVENSPLSSIDFFGLEGQANGSGSK